MSDSTHNTWWFDTATGEVSQGKVSGWETRMGPYPSREDAEQALQRARQRTEAADAYDQDSN